MEFKTTVDSRGIVHKWKLYRGDDDYIYIVTGISTPIDDGILSHILKGSEDQTPLSNIVIESIDVNKKYFSGMHTVNIYPMGRTLEEHHFSYKTGAYHHAISVYGKDMVLYKRLCDINKTNITYIRPLSEFYKVVSDKGESIHYLFEEVIGYMNNGSPYTEQDIIQPIQPSKIDKFWGLV